MATEKESADKIIAALNSRVGPPKPCVICGNNSWLVNARFARIPATRNANNAEIGTHGYPFTMIVCGHCGNTHLINLLVLGFTTEQINELAWEDKDGSQAK